MWYLPIVGHPVQLHSSRDPGNCTLTPEKCAYKTQYWVFWYEADHVFALPTLYFFIVAIALFALFRLASEYAPRPVAQNPLWRRAQSALRFLSYKNWRIGSWNSQSLGVFLLGGVGVIFFACMTLAPRPYYWPTDAHYGNSPPIATRTGWMALACLPFVLALSAKANMISALTGVSHEKLNVWHNWISWAMFVLALIHTFPFIIYHEWVGDLHDTFVDGGLWLTGVIALIAEAWLMFMSFSFIRNRYYEFFKVTHFFAAMTFLVFFFLHCGFVLTSWDYFIATGVIYSLCLLYALGKTYFRHGINHTARLRLETPHALRVAVETKAGWNPGQHVFLRFLACGMHALTAHPYTICSIPAKESGSSSEMVFYVQPRGGLTGRLASMAQKQQGTAVKVLLEGPYGGLPKRWSRGFDRTLVIGGGSGCGFTLSLVEDWMRSRTASQQLMVVLATRDPETRIWYLEELQRMASRQGESNLSEVPGLSIHFYETHLTHETVEDATSSPAVADPDAGTSGDEDEKRRSPHIGSDKPAYGETGSVASLFGVKFYQGRPDTKQALRGLSFQDGATVGVTVCGPSSMVYDVSSEAAAAQQRIVAGKIGAAELWLHREAFSY